MRKIALWLVVAVIAAWAAFYAFAEMRAREYAARTWPAGLGLVFDVPRRYPPTEINAEAKKLTTLASALDIDFGARRSGKKQPEISDYVQAELARRSAVIEAPPPIVATYLADHDAALAVVRQHLLASTLQWQTRLDEGMD
ncbi:MAG TPA: hypothetical protein VMU84_07910, partial [Thermoanaerobaculia bacterium]|nr:hypothetical protein [Thermoanaerobaculia bacterium]